MVTTLPDYRKERIKIPPEQREGKIWSLEQKQLLIDSIYNGFDIPKIYFREDYTNPAIWYLIDGQQRVGSIIEFLKNKFSLSTGVSTIPERMWDRKFSQLNLEDRQKVNSFTLDAVLFSAEDETEEEDMFLRLNNGTPLNAAEKRNAITGAFRDSVKSLATHSFFKQKVNFPSKRYAHEAVAAQLSLIALRGGPTNLKGNDLKKIYKEKREYPDKADIETKVNRTLNLMNKVFKKKEAFMKKFYVISAFDILFYLDQNFALTNTITPIKIYKFFQEFERARYLNAEKSEDDKEFNSELNEFYDKTVNSPDSEDAVKTRHQILFKYFLAKFPNLQTKDKQRLFSGEQKLAIYYLSKGLCAGVRGFKCSNKGKSLSIEAGDFDHKKEFSMGGKTVVSNGQFLCKKCHICKTSLRGH